jgi:hypothetical protein
MKRRTFIAASAATLAAPRAALAAPEGDAGLIEACMRAQHKVMAALEGALAAGAEGEELRLVTRMRDHDIQHLRVLDASLEALGALKPRAPGPNAGGGLGPIGEAKIEVLDAHRAAARELLDARLLQTIASMAAAQGQHLVAITRFQAR